MKLRNRNLIYIFVVVCLFCITSTAEAALIGRWKLDEGTGTTATDSSGNGYNGTWSGTSSGNTGYYDTNATSSLSYSGSFSSGDDQVLVTGISTVVKSVTFWAYIPDLNGTTEMVSKSSSGQGFEVIINGGTIQFYTMGSDVISATASSGDINLNAWNHVVATYNGPGTTMRLYINGAASGSTGTAPASVTNVDNLYFGTWGSGGRQFVGKLNDIRLYDVELNSTQVGNVMGGSVDPDTAPDSTAPTISSIVATASSTGATVTWTTNEVASTKVVYSVDSNYASTTSEIDTSTRVTSHSQSIYNLNSCTTYNFKVVSRDAVGNSATSSAQSLTTTGCPTESSSVNRRKGTSVANRIKNLIELGNISNAEQLKNEWSWLFSKNENATLKVRDLYFGLSGDDVKALQTILISKGYGIPAGVTGSFFGQTKSALAAYQRDNNIFPAVGYFGSVTREQMKMSGLKGLWW